MRARIKAMDDLGSHSPNLKDSHSKLIKSTGPSVISPADLFSLLSKPTLLLDARPIEDYIHGHIGWKKSSIQGIPNGGIIQIEPDSVKPR